MNKKKIAVIGGDVRMVAAADYLNRKFCTVLCGFDTDGEISSVDSFCCSDGIVERPTSLDGFHIVSTLEDALNGCDAILLPLPAITGNNDISMPLSNRKISIGELRCAIKQNGVQKLFGGMLGKLADECRSDGITVIDYFELEEFVTANALLTAEGAVFTAMEELPISIHGAHVLVVGNGRIGKLLANKLAALNAEVTVSARRPVDFALIKAAGLKSADTNRLIRLLSKEHFDVIFNTVPALLFDYPVLEAMPKNTLLIDLASKPGGVDISAARTLGRRVIWALSMPGRYAPVSAGKVIGEVIERSLE